MKHAHGLIATDHTSGERPWRGKRRKKQVLSKRMRLLASEDGHETATNARECHKLLVGEGSLAQHEARARATHHGAVISRAHSRRCIAQTLQHRAMDCAHEHHFYTLDTGYLLNSARADTKVRSHVPLTPEYYYCIRKSSLDAPACPWPPRSGPHARRTTPPDQSRQVYREWSVTRQQWTLWQRDARPAVTGERRYRCG
jgi:hypothetical protein